MLRKLNCHVLGALFVLSAICIVPSQHGMAAKPLQIHHHDLEVQLFPESHEMVARDQLKIQGELSGRTVLPFRLNQNLMISEMFVGSQPVPIPDVESEGIGKNAEKRQKDELKEEAQTQTIEIILPESVDDSRSTDVTLVYRGKVKDPPRPSPGLRFVRPDQTIGHIGREGVYLTAETYWYPSISGSLSTYDVRVTLPQGWDAITHGKEVRREPRGNTVTSQWQIRVPSEGLTLVANRFVRNQRIWKGIEIETYLFPEDAGLADEYLSASVRYLETYVKRLGPYPFPKFAVVENFFPSGLGFPSFTLLGQGIIRRNYTHAYALGHEIVHCWFGNYVLNDFDKGNWVEGLTTYLANYYYEELTGSIEQAIDQRRMMVLGHSVFVYPEVDYPIIRFHHKETRRDNAIGYQKAAMVFHMLRRELGDDVFFAGIRRLVADFGGTYAEWSHLETVFEREADRDLRWFFEQWIERPSGPSLKIIEAKAAAVNSTSGRYSARLRVAQEGGLYRVQLPVFIEMAGGQIYKTMIQVDSGDQVFIFQVPARPVRLELDPEFETFRRIQRDGIQPMLNLWVTDQKRVVVIPTNRTVKDNEPYQSILNRIQSEEQVVEQWEDSAAEGFQNASALVLGSPDVNRKTKLAVAGCQGEVELSPEGVRVKDDWYRGNGIAVLVTCLHPELPGSVISVFYGVSPQAAASVARLLFFYGWQSYVIFDNGKVIKRGDFSPAKNVLEVRFDAV